MIGLICTGVALAVMAMLSAGSYLLLRRRRWRRRVIYQGKCSEVSSRSLGLLRENWEWSDNSWRWLRRGEKASTIKGVKRISLAPASANQTRSPSSVVPRDSIGSLRIENQSLDGSLGIPLCLPRLHHPVKPSHAGPSNTNRHIQPMPSSRSLGLQLCGLNISDTDVIPLDVEEVGLTTTHNVGQNASPQPRSYTTFFPPLYQSPATAPVEPLGEKFYFPVPQPLYSPGFPIVSTLPKLSGHSVDDFSGLDGYFIGMDPFHIEGLASIMRPTESIGTSPHPESYQNHSPPSYQTNPPSICLASTIASDTGSMSKIRNSNSEISETSASPGEKSSPFQESIESRNSTHCCKVCDRTFDSQHEYDQHMRYHLKPEKCLHCERRFRTTTHLKQHVNDVHETTHKYCYTMPRCKFTHDLERENFFKQKSDWKRRMGKSPKKFDYIVDGLNQEMAVL